MNLYERPEQISEKDRPSTSHLLVTVCLLKKKVIGWYMKIDICVSFCASVCPKKNETVILHKGTNLVDVRMASNVRQSHGVGWRVFGRLNPVTTRIFSASIVIFQ